VKGPSGDWEMRIELQIDAEHKWVIHCPTTYLLPGPTAPPATPDFIAQARADLDDIDRVNREDLPDDMIREIQEPDMQGMAKQILGFDAPQDVTGGGA